MRKLFLLTLCFMMLIAVGIVFGQTPSSGFEEIQTIGQPRPRGFQYDVNFDRLVWVDARGRLQLVDATTFEVQHTLYQSGFYNAYEFSHDGRYLAIAIETRFEIYDTENGELLLTFAPDGALRAEGPLYWSNDDTLLGVNLQVRAPQAIRRSENDTTNLPYVWDIVAEFGERRTVLPGARAIPFFDYRNGFVYGSNNKAIVGLPERLQVLDITPSGVDVIAELPSTRFERDPIFVWTSLRDDLMYIRPNQNRADIVQLDTATGTLTTLFIGGDMDTTALSRLENLQLSAYSQRIGDPLDTQENSLLRFLLGNDYRAQFGYHPITVTLVDYLEPATPDTGDRMAILLYIFDETRGVGRFELIDIYSATGVSLNPNGTQLAFRTDTNDARINIYYIASGQLLNTFTPSMPEIVREGVFGFNATGEVILSDFERFDTVTGEVLIDNLHYNNGYDRFFWDEGAEHIVTVTGTRWWVWDVRTGNIIRREELRLTEPILAVADDGERYLTAPLTGQMQGTIGTTYEMVEIGNDDRVRVDFENLPHVIIENIILSPDGQNYLVIYSVNPNGQHAPANEIMLYNLDEGAKWHIAGDDLPFMTNRQYGWLDNETAYIYSEEGTSAPERIYDLAYHASGVPQCLVDTFPDEVGAWSLVWERLSYRLPTEEYNLLAQATCEVLPVETSDVVIDFIFPTVTPTRLPVTATPSTIVGVPTCLTNRFSAEARDYAVIWQELIDGRSDGEIEELELLLCENITGQDSPQSEAQLRTNNITVMTIDMATGRREVGAFIPDNIDSPPPNLDLVNRAFRQQYGFMPDGQLSDDLSLFAVRTQRNQLAIYRLLTPYARYAADATATLQVAEAQEAPENFLSLRPTATQGFTYLGEARPTLTPTVTPTSPPLPDSGLLVASSDVTETICPYTERFTLDNPPPDFDVQGLIITRSNNTNFLPTPIPVVTDNQTQVDSSANLGRWVLNPMTGDWQLDDTLPLCYVNDSCDFTFDSSWVVYRNEASELIVSRPDGSQSTTLFNATQMDTFQNIQWRGNRLYFVEIEPPSADNRTARSVLKVFDPVTQAITVVEDYPEREAYNNLPTNILLTQTGATDRYQLVSVPFTTASGEGQRYFIYDQQEVEYLYFARLSDIAVNDALSASWHPMGTALYFNLPNDDQTYAFIPADESFVRHGEIQRGLWSRDGLRRVATLSLPQHDRDNLIEEHQPVPNIEIWDSETGIIRRYCVSGFEKSDVPETFLWSPDNRYLAFQSVVPQEAQFTGAPLRTFILDTQTGSVTEISKQAGTLVLWHEGATE